MTKTTETISIYQRYGGFDFFHASIFHLYLDMFDHPEISYHFIGVDIKKLALNQTHYLIRAIGGPDLYEGRPIEVVHKGMDITPFQFEEIAHAFRDVFLTKGVTPIDAATIMDFVAGHRSEIVTAKTSLIDKIMRPFYHFLRRHFGTFFSKQNSWIRSGKIKKK